MQTRIKAVFYDFDGVLQDSMPEEYKGCAAVFKAAGLEPPSLQCFCKTASTLTGGCLKGRGGNMPYDGLLCIYYANINKRLPALFPGFAEARVRFKQAGMKLGVVSACDWLTLRDNLERHDLIKFLDVALGESEDKTKGILKACEESEVLPEQALYVGDLTSDIRDGKAAGVMTVAFIGPEGDSSVFNGIKPNFRVMSHHALANMLLGF